MKIEEDVLYYWKNGELYTSSWEDMYEETVCYVLDASEDTPNNRYGLWGYLKTWESVDFDAFPAEFKTSLLLLGVT